MDDAEMGVSNGHLLDDDATEAFDGIAEEIKKAWQPWHAKPCKFSTGARGRPSMSAIRVAHSCI